MKMNKYLYDKKTTLAIEKSLSKENISSLGLGIRVKTLVNLRWIAVLGQTITCLIVHYFLNFELPWTEVSLTILALAISNFALYPGYSINNRLNETSTTFVIAADIIQLALMIFFTGGLSNPFVVLFLTHIAITVTSLPIRSTSILIILTIFLITILGFFNYPLVNENLDLTIPLIFIIGMWISLFVTILFLTFYAGGLTDDSRKTSAALKIAEDLLVNEKNLSSLDGLAAAAAHHLGTPLGTISLIANELKNEIDMPDSAKKDLIILSDEVEKCKAILGSLGVEFLINFQSNDPNLKKFLLLRRSELLLGLSNIVENAADFTSSIVELNVNYNNENIELKIQDNGKGFSNTILNRLGDPYVSSRSSSIQKDDEGSGLGLGFFISKTLLERLGIKITAYNRPPPETGAIVSVLIPTDKRL